MKKSIFVAMTASAVIASGLGFASPATATVPADTTTTVTTQAVPVVTLKAKSVQYSKKLENCFARASKREQPARPRDPQALCKGKVKVRLVAVATASCPAPWLGGWATGSAHLRNTVKVRAFSKSVATGRVWTKVRSKIRMKVAKAKAKASVTCVAPPGVTPPPPPPCPPGSIWDSYTQSCAKDGSTTPPPPGDAPGPNPTPVPGPGGGGPSECYDPQTGLPVPPGTPGAWCAA